MEQLLIKGSLPFRIDRMQARICMVTADANYVNVFPELFVSF